MKLNKVLLCAICTGILSHPADAALNGCNIDSFSDKITNVYFANGVGTAKDDADAFLIDMRIAYDAQFRTIEENSEYTWSTAYNYTQGYLTDVIQVFQQKMEEQGVVGISSYEVYQLIAAGLSNDAIRTYLAAKVSDSTLIEYFTDELLEWLAESMLEIHVNALNDRLLVNSEHVGIYEANLLAGERVLILAHSQGNLFTNEAIAQVRANQTERADSISYFGVATPASSTTGDAQYVTANDDVIINGLRIFEDVLPSNLDNDPGILNDNRSLWNHLIARDYFDPSLASRAVINEGMLQLASSTPYPTQIAGTGAIRASLTWGDQPDVDLHTFEPSGAHVYFSNRIGDDGTLDVDDTDGRGPENYVVPCDSVSEGTYKIGVNYFRGNAPETASIALFLGDGRNIAPRNLLLELAKAQSGNSNPSIMFEVTVTDDGEGNAVYTVN